MAAKAKLYCKICYAEIKKNAGSDKVPLCKGCFDHHFEKCCQCGRVVAQSQIRFVDGDTNYPYCEYCMEDNKPPIT